MDTLGRLCGASERLPVRVDREGGMADCLRRSRERQRHFAAMLQSFGWDTTEHPFEARDGTGTNIVARRPTATEQPYVLFGCHSDYCAGEGANDNGTGMAVCAEIARRISETIYANYCGFAAFDMEERGLLGSSAYTRQKPFGLPKFFINIDSLSGDDIFAMHIPQTMELVRSLANAAFAQKTKLYGVDATRIHISSDHIPFWGAGVNSTMIVGYGAEAHGILAANLDAGEQRTQIMNGCTTANTPTDILANVHPENMVKTVRMLVHWVTN